MNTATAAAEDPDIGQREQLARLDQMHADIQLKLVQAQQAKMFEGWRVAFAGMTAGAALFAAGAAFMKLLGS